MSQNVKTLELGGRNITLVGTAHISKSSVDETIATIQTERPDTVCVELDEARWKAIVSPNAWEHTDIVKIIKEGKAFLLLANLTLASFQRRLGLDNGMKPGAEMIAAVGAAQELGIPYRFCDRDVQTTLRRAWSASNFWNKSKLAAQLIAAAFSNEKASPEEIERLKNRSELDEMMSELAHYLPSVKQVLIDERDRYIASKIWTADGASVVAILGAGHIAGVETWLKRFSEGESTDVAELESLPPKGFFARSAGWLIPAVIVGFVALGFVRFGAGASLAMLLRWVLFNGTLAAIGAALCLAHPLSVLTAFVAAPIATLHPLLAVGFFSGIMEAWLRKPRVSDFQTLSTDITSFKGFYNNKVTHILLVFMLSSFGGAIGNFIVIPLLAKAAL